MKVVVGGPPHSGKSTFTAGLIERIRERKRERGYNVSFMWMSLDVTDNTLNWLLDESGEVSRRAEDVSWNEQTAQTRKNTFEGRNEELVIADAPGQITSELEIVAGPADAMIILASEERAEDIDNWKNAADDLDIDVGWILTSVIDADTDPGWHSNNGIRKGVIRSIGRDEFVEREVSAYDDTSARMVRQISTDLIKRAAQNGRRESNYKSR